MSNPLVYSASNHDGRKAQVRHSGDPYEKGYSVFTWYDNGTGVILWREKHELTYETAFQFAKAWLKDEG